VKLAEEAIRVTYARGKVPVVVGGTAFYLKNLIYGLAPAPPSSKVVRERLKTELTKFGLEAMYERLVSVDPAYARTITPHDNLRIVRALEVYESSGKPLSSFGVPSEKNPGYAFFLAGISLDRGELYRKIDARVDAMFEQGLADEVKRCIALGYGPEDPGMKGIGYAEFFLARRGCCNLTGTRDLIKKNSRRFAKRQLTFFRSFAETVWFRPDETERFRIMLLTFLEGTHSGDFDPNGIFSARGGNIATI
jgi:tRNA dimethylallyltransferase